MLQIFFNINMYDLNNVEGLGNRTGEWLSIW